MRKRHFLHCADDDDDEDLQQNASFPSSSSLTIYTPFPTITLNPFLFHFFFKYYIFIPFLLFTREGFRLDWLELDGFDSKTNSKITTILVLKYNKIYKWTNTKTKKHCNCVGSWELFCASYIAQLQNHLCYCWRKLLCYCAFLCFTLEEDK